MSPATWQIPSANSSARSGADAAGFVAPSGYLRSTEIPYCPLDSHTVSPETISPWVNPRSGCGIVRTTRTR